MRCIRLLIFAVLCASLALAQSHSVALTWAWLQGTGPAATGFKVKNSQTSGGPYTVLTTTTTPAVFTYTDTLVVGGQSYYYVISAYNADGESANSVELKVPVPSTPPLPPTSPSAVAK